MKYSEWFKLEYYVRGKSGQMDKVKIIQRPETQHEFTKGGNGFSEEQFKPQDTAYCVLPSTHKDVHKCLHDDNRYYTEKVLFCCVTGQRKCKLRM